MIGLINTTISLTHCAYTHTHVIWLYLPTCVVYFSCSRVAQRKLLASSSYSRPELALALVD